MALIKGKQIATTPNGIATANINDGALSADAAGRGKMATGYFDSTTTTDDKFSAASIGLDRLEEAVIQADGGQAFTGAQSMGSNKLTNLANGTLDSDAVNLGQLQGAVAGLSWKDAVKAATTAPIATANTYANGTAGVGATLTADVDGAWATSDSDGVTLIVGDRLLVKDETGADAPHNGIYVVTDLGDGSSPWILTRATDADSADEQSGAAAFIQEGTVNEDMGWTQTVDSPTIGTTDLDGWIQFTGAAAISYEIVGNITAVDAGDAAAAGVRMTAARGDHQHAVSTGAAGAAAVGDSATEGSSTDLARADHTHSFAGGTPVGLGDANAAGAGTDFARGNHVHKRDVVRQEAVTTQTITGTDTAVTDTLDATPLANAQVSLYLNGVLQEQGVGNDYTLSGVTITWLASTGTAVDMETTDTLLATYSSAA